MIIMAWIIPAVLFALAVMFWRLSFKTDDHIVAWCRFLFAVFLLILALIYGFAVAFS